MLGVNAQTTIIFKLVYLKKQSEREREREGYDKIMIKPTLLQVW